MTLCDNKLSIVCRLCTLLDPVVDLLKCFLFCLRHYVKMALRSWTD